MKKFFVFFVCFFIVLPLFAENKRQNVVIYVDSGYPPYSFEGEKKDFALGIYIDVLNQVFEKMSSDYDISIIPVPWQRGINATKSSEVFGLAPPYLIHNERSWLSYSDPVLTEKLAVFCNDSKGKWPEDYRGKKVAINYGFVFPKEIKAQLQQLDMKIVNPKNNIQSLQYLVSKEADCYINDKNSVYYSINKMVLPKMVFLKAELNQVYGYLAYSNNLVKFPYGPDFISKFNTILKQMKSEGKIEQIIDAYLKK